MSRDGNPVGSAGAAASHAPGGPLLYEFIRRGQSFSGRERNCCFLNTGQERFADVSSATAWAFPDDSRSISQVDWDLDGDLDYWISNRNGPQVRYIQNNVSNDHHFLHLRLTGTSSNRDAIGARVTVTMPDGTQLVQSVRAGDGFLAQSTKAVHVGLGDLTDIAEVNVRWPGGDWEEFRGIHVDGFFQLVEHTGMAEPFLPKKQLVRGVVENSMGRSPAETEADSSATARIISASRVPVPRLTYRSLPDGQQRRVLSTPDLQATNTPLVTLINLWSIHCQPCLAELAEWTAHEEELRLSGIDVVAINVDTIGTPDGGSSQDVERVAERIRFPFRIGIASAATIEKLHLLHDFLFDFRRELSVPTSILIDSTGRVAVFYRGTVAYETLMKDAHRLSTPRAHLAASTPFPGRWHYQRPELNPFDFVWELVRAGFLDESAAYVNEHAATLKKHFNFAKLLVLIGNGRLARGEAAEAIALYRRSIAVDPSYSEAQNNLAWLLATHADASVRDPKEALRLATIATQTNKTPAALDTLAAAHASAGQFEEAIEAITSGIEQAKQSGARPLAAQMQERLELYEKRRPFRE